MGDYAVFEDAEQEYKRLSDTLRARVASLGDGWLHCVLWLRHVVVDTGTLGWALPGGVDPVRRVSDVSKADVRNMENDIKSARGLVRRLKTTRVCQWYLTLLSVLCQIRTMDMEARSYPSASRATFAGKLKLYRFVVARSSCEQRTPAWLFGCVDFVPF